MSKCQGLCTNGQQCRRRVKNKYCYDHKKVNTNENANQKEKAKTVVVVKSTYDETDSFFNSALGVEQEKVTIPVEFAPESLWLSNDLFFKMLDPQNKIILLPIRNLLSIQTNRVSILNVQDLEQKIRVEGLIEPLMIYHSKMECFLHEGHHRLTVLHRNNIKYVPVQLIEVNMINKFIYDSGGVQPFSSVMKGSINPSSDAFQNS